MKKILRLGTRRSPLALIQAEDVRAKLRAAHPHLREEADIEIVPIRTSGDWRPNQKERSFLEIGGDKGLFTKELEEALIAGTIDMAVHSMKDMPSRLPDDLEIAAMPERADPRDAFIARDVKTLAELPSGAAIGTSSLRRQAQILAKRPDLRVVCCAAMSTPACKNSPMAMRTRPYWRLPACKGSALSNHISSILEAETMLPAAGQGALAIEIHRDDRRHAPSSGVSSIAFPPLPA